MGNIQAYMLLSAGYLILYWLLGALPGKNWRSESVPMMCLTGFLIYYTLFQLLAFPMKYFQISFTLLTKAWSGTLLVLLLFVLFFRYRVLIESIRNFFEAKERMFLSLILILVTALFAVYIGINTNNISPFDAAYYIGNPLASVYSDTLEKISPYTGKMMSEPEHFYILNTDMLHSAFTYKVTGIHPLAERKFSFTVAMVCLFEMTICSCGEKLLKKEYLKQGIFFFFANLVLFYSYSISGVSQYFFYRTYEGKSVVCYMYTLAVFSFALSLYKNGMEKSAYLGLILCATSAISFSNTALFLIPLAIGCSMLPFTVGECLKNRSFQCLGYLILVLLPSAAWLAVYMVV